ncbi:response regulator transcription factor [Streptomyces sp. NPDC059788]|uniref:helix-turn-helix transcriptional regulator n=1 Tax=Streptomyces sp. NPDC059788 TaxID=3346948 RepID=UPI00364EC32A
MLELAVAVLESPDVDRPWPLVQAELARVLQSSAVAMSETHWQRREGRVLTWMPSMGPRQNLTALVVRQVRAGVPFSAYYSTGADSTPLTAAQISGERDWRNSESYSIARETLGAHMLAIPLPAPAGVARGFVIHHWERDFSAAERAYARRIQPLLTGIDRHQQHLRRWRAAQDPATGPAVRDAVTALRLTPREVTVLHLLGRTLTAAAIARRLGISPRTVHNHVRNLYRKLGTADRLAAVMRAQQLGLLPPSRAAAPGSDHRLARVGGDECGW